MAQSLPTWNLSALASGDTDSRFSEWRTQATTAYDAFVTRWAAPTVDFTQPETLCAALTDYEALMRTYAICDRESYYFYLRSNQNQSDPKIKAALQNVMEFERNLQNRIQFFTIRVSHIPTTAQATLIADTRLAPWHYFLQRLWQHAAHTLSEPEEKIMTLTHENSLNRWVSMTSTLVHEETATITVDAQSKLRTFEELLSDTTDREATTRQAAASGIQKILDRWQPVAEYELNAVLHHAKVQDELRHHDRPDAHRHLADDIDTAVVDTILETVEQHYSIAHDFYKLKATLLGQDQLTYAERNAPIGTLPTGYTWDQAVELVGQTFTSLDPTYGNLLDSFVRSGQIDAQPQAGKQGGAFCVATNVTLPTYILMNFNGRLRDLTTLAHECGHGIHNELMRQSNSPLYFGAPTPLAEVASIFTEDFVTHRATKDLPASDRLAVLMAKLGDEIAAIFRQVALYRFEQELHQTYRQRFFIPASDINAMFVKHMSAYLGPAVTVTTSGNWWMYWSHIRMYFYVYSYVCGAMIAKSFQHQYHQDPQTIGRLKTMLAAGSSQSPRALFQQQGIDITQPAFWESGLAQIKKDLTEAQQLAATIRP